MIETNWDKKIRELNQRLLDCVKPRLPGVKFQNVPSSQIGKSYLIIEVSKSWNSPHRADFGGVNRFYGRASRNNYELSVEELRRIFNRHTDMLDRLEGYRELWLEKIRKGITPVPLEEFDGLFVLHLVPAQSLLGEVSFDLESAQTHAQKNSMGLGFANPYFNFEGLVGGLGNPDEYYNCTQLNRNGIFEHIVPKIIHGGCLHTPTFGSAVYRMCDTFIDFYRSVAITPPFFLLISFLDVKGAGILNPEKYTPMTRSGRTIIKQDLKLPRVEISEFLPLEERLKKTRPALNALWNAISVPRSPIFGDDGSWRLKPT